MTIFSWHSHPVPKHELSSRPERSEVEGPAVFSTSNQSESKRCPRLCHPERSREPALSEVEIILDADVVISGDRHESLLSKSLYISNFC
jgi:hypothetical protein